MWSNHLDDEHGRYLTPYSTNTGLGEHGDELMYDQTNKGATMASGIEDQAFALPAEEHPELLFPLETIMSNWAGMIEPGKVTASPAAAENEKYGP